MKGRGGMYRRMAAAAKRLFTASHKKEKASAAPFKPFPTVQRTQRKRKKHFYPPGNTKALHGRHGRGLDYSKQGTRSEHRAREME